MDCSVTAIRMRPQLALSVVEAITKASEMQSREADAVLRIQAVYRMALVRRGYHYVRSAVMCIQRMYRGHMQRKRVGELRRQMEEAHEMAVYEYYAARIQACFRGFYVRRYVDNFYARKQYILEATKASEEVREMALQMHEKQAEEEAAACHALQELRYKQATERLHHMVSTVSASGVYRPPLNVTGATTVYGTNVETDIRQNAAAARRPHHLSKIRKNLRSILGTAKRQDTTPHPLKPGTCENVDEEVKPKEPFMKFVALRGAWNRSGVQGCSLPPIIPLAAATGPNSSGHTSTVNGRLVKGKVVSHTCIEDWTPMYDTETADLERRVDAKGVQTLHGTKPFVVPAPRRIPL